MALLALASLGVSRCGGGASSSVPPMTGSSETTPGSCQITGTAASGSVTATGVVSLTVQ